MEQVVGWAVAAYYAEPKPSLVTLVTLEAPEDAHVGGSP
jgi:hypothetical protein